MNKITIVIPNYNGKAFLKDCLQAIYQQEDAPEFEVLIVDNASSDGSLEEAERFFPSARTIRLSENTGFCHAVNVGIQESKSPFVLLLNNDTKIKSGFINSLYHAIVPDESLFSVSAQMLQWDREDLLDDAGDQFTLFGWAYGRGKGRPATKYRKACPVFSACGGAAIYRRSVFDEIGLFDELHFAYLEDLDIGYRARIHGYRNAYAPGAAVIHYGSAASGSRYNAFKARLSAANNVYVIYKNMPVLQLFLNLPWLITGFFIKWLFYVRKGLGRIYAEGLCIGWKRCFSAEGHSCKVKFQWKHLKNYVIIQWYMFINVFKML